MTSSIFCFATRASQAYRIVSRLRAAGIERRDISMLCSAHPIGDPAGRTGGAMGLLAKPETLTFPGLAPFVAAGPVLALLGSPTAGVAGVFANLNIPDDEAARYESRVAEGDALIVVRATNRDTLVTARRVFEEADADEVRMAPSSAPAVSAGHT
jgi:hypothetical protein